jgi:hypothetical protein
MIMVVCSSHSVAGRALDDFLAYTRDDAIFRAAWFVKTRMRLGFNPLQWGLPPHATIVVKRVVFMVQFDNTHVAFSSPRDLKGYDRENVYFDENLPLEMVESVNRMSWGSR